LGIGPYKKEISSLNLYLTGHTYQYAAEQVLLLFFPEERPLYPDGPPTGDRAELSLRFGARYVTAHCKLVLDGQSFSGAARVAAATLTNRLLTDRLCQRMVKKAFYRAALRSGCPKPVWGSLTGIRPGKLMSGYLASGLSEGQALTKFCRDWDVSPARARLCLDTAKASRAVAASLAERDVCLYAGIPFCPSRCAYCSFVSQSVEKSMALLEPFLEALFREIDATAEILERLRLRPVALYIGGGTPTTLSAAQLEALCARLASRFDLGRLTEYCVEAGRPDTITAEKLAVLREFGVTRLSVNPQSMCDGVLGAIGRKHTAADIEAAVDIARKTGGFALNMDLIAGLPTDTPRGFSHTLNRVLALEPENITVHTLARKKGSAITEGRTPLPSAAEVEGMLNEAAMRLPSAGYTPYYLYRQKFMAGGFENVGWSRPGFLNRYNVCIMEELCGVIAMGGGASTKLVSPKGRIERVFAPKYPKEYIAGVEKVLAEKVRIEDFYHEF